MIIHTFHQLTDHVYWLSPDSATDRPVLGVVVGANGTLVVDAGNSPSHVSVAPGCMNALLAASTRLMPRQLAAIRADRLMTAGNAQLWHPRRHTANPRWRTLDELFRYSVRHDEPFQAGDLWAAFGSRQFTCIGLPAKVFPG